MSNFLSKISIGFCLLFMQSKTFSLEPSNCIYVKSIISKFVSSKSNQDWDVLEDFSEKNEACQCNMAPILYFINRMKVVLPNSQVLQGISPNQFILSHKLKMKEQLEILKGCDEKDFMPLVNSMIKQNFDEEISITANDIKKNIGSK